MSERQNRLSVVAFILATCGAVTLALATGPRFPFADSALFEFVGRSLANGQHLYSDIWDNKLPGIYLLNEALWRLFGDNYAAHLAAETALSAATIALFAFVLTRFRIRHWESATLAFAVFYLFVGGPPNETEHYATPFIFAAVALSAMGRYALCGLALAVATTFWVPSFVAGAIPIGALANRGGRIVLWVSLGVALVALATSFLYSFGSRTALELVQSWISYIVGNYRHTNYQPAQHRYLFPLLSPAYYIQSGLGVLLFALAVFWRKDSSRAARFALLWSAGTLAIVAVLGKPSQHYFLLLYGPLIMLIWTQHFSFAAIRKRWIFSGAALACAILMCVVQARNALADNGAVLNEIRYSGEKIRGTYGAGAVGMLPWEGYLTSYAVPPGRFFLARVVGFAADRDTWTKQPVVYVDDAALQFNRLPPPATLRIRCRDALTGPLTIYTREPIKGMPCKRV